MRGQKSEAPLDAGKAAVEIVPPAPSWLSADAKKEWKKVAPILIKERRTLTIADLASFANYCVAVGEAVEASRIIATEGLTFQTEKSGPKKHPAVSIRSNAMTQARLYATELGLTPVSRSRPALRPESPEDEPTIMDI